MVVVPGSVSFLALCHSMESRTALAFEIKEGSTILGGIVNSIQAEDGSGKSWNVTLDSGVKLYVRTR